MEGASNYWVINRQYKDIPGHHLPEFDICRDLNPRLNPRPSSLVDHASSASPSACEVGLLSQHLSPSSTFWYRVCCSPVDAFHELR
ncbi:hypothetical protein KC19_12G105800 [Ceratodon purpureus]|uniref:Uncharacterized protein n=1 Tax=Ceratodon purpureus TaxID=3225 RepID=A0A8T0GBH9_CERPU|nr:hypothetical protein KC19_12G105800 [Ceratodon purpureus]